MSKRSASKSFLRKWKLRPTDQMAGATSRALNWIMRQRSTEVSVEDIRRDALAQKLMANKTQRLLDGLVEARYLRPLVPADPGAGRPKHRWLVNPKLIARRGAGIAENAEKPDTRLAA